MPGGFNPGGYWSDEASLDFLTKTALGQSRKASGVALPNVANAVAVSDGGTHACAIDNEAGLWCWGQGSFGTFGDGKDSVKNIANVEPQFYLASHHTFAPVRAKIANVSQVAAGDNWTCALVKDGTVSCWGLDSYRRLGLGPKVTSKVWTAGWPDKTPVYSEPQVVPGLSEVVEISLGGLHACALKKDETVWCWGNNQGGQIGNGKTSYSVSSPTQVNLPD